VFCPLLFYLYSEAGFESALRNTEDGIKINGQVVNNLRFADDTVILGLASDRINTEGERLGLKINADQTKIMVVSRTSNINTSKYPSKQ